MAKTTIQSDNRNDELDLYPKHYLYRRIVQAKLYIDNNFANNIDISNIADEAYFSKFHFIRLFKHIYNKTPHQYLIYVRIEKAIQLLRQQQNVSEVCAAVGFESISSFSGLFKKITGKTPSTFIQQEQHRLQLHREKPLNYIPGCFALERGWTNK